MERRTVRKDLWITPADAAMLAKLAAKTRRSEAAVLREGLYRLWEEGVEDTTAAPSFFVSGGEHD